MKHILKFVLQTLVVVFVFTPVVIGRYIWTFKWNDKFDGFLGMGIYSVYKRSYNNLLKRMKGQPVHSTF